MMTYKSIIRCISAAALLLCCAGCTDDWDEHYDDSAGANNSATLSLWQQIQARPDLRNFAIVCEATPFRTSETNKAKGFTFANALGKPMADGTCPNLVQTLFAPVITDAQRDSLLNIIAEGGEWEVQTQFLSNHIRRNRLDISGSGNTKIYMLNSKIYDFSSADSTLNGIKIKAANIQATNGVMHVMDGIVNFRYNLHEYLRFLARERGNKFASFIVSGDSAMFNASKSIEGEPDELGRTTYIDSVFDVTNKYLSPFYTIDNSVYSEFSFSGMGYDRGYAGIVQEDSSYAAIIPDNNAYDAAIEKYKKYFKYAEWYENNKARNNITSANGAGCDAVVRSIPTVEDVENMQKYLDSLQLMRARSYVMRSLLFNINEQYRGPKGTQDYLASSFDEWLRTGMVDSVGLLTTMGDTLRKLPYRPYYRRTQYANIDGAQQVIGINWDVLGSTWDENVSFDPISYFDGKQPERLSNGLAYLVGNYNLNSFMTLHKDYIVQIESALYQTNITGAQVKKMVLGPIVEDSIMDIRGRVSDRYMSTESSGVGAVKFTVRLPQVLSAKYDIYVVTVPEFYNSGAFRQASFRTALNYRGSEVMDDNVKGNYSVCYNDQFRLSDNAEDQKIKVDTSYVHTYLLYKDFEFPYSYASLSNSYPTLTFEIDGYTTRERKTKTNNLCIDFIYLKAKED